MNPRRSIVDLELAIDVGNQVRQRLVHPGQILAGETALDVVVGAHAEKHRVEFFARLSNGDVAADLDVEAKFHTHVFHDLAALLDDILLQLEWRNAEGQQAADLRVAVEYHRRHAVAHQNVGAGETRRTRAHHGDALAGAHHIRHVGLPALLERFVRDVLLDGADADRAEAVVQRARALAQPVLRTNAAAHFRQRIRLMRQFRRLEQLAVVHQRQPVRNVVVNRALPFAERVAAGNAAPGLGRRLLRRCTAE